MHNDIREAIIDALTELRRDATPEEIAPGLNSILGSNEQLVEDILRNYEHEFCNCQLQAEGDMDMEYDLVSDLTAITVADLEDLVK